MCLRDGGSTPGPFFPRFRVQTLSVFTAYFTGNPQSFTLIFFSLVSRLFLNFLPVEMKIALGLYLATSPFLFDRCGAVLSFFFETSLPSEYPNF